ncbi:MAG: hypothetical protein V4560_02220 [Bacteroidota bacterium]
MGLYKYLAIAFLLAIGQVALAQRPLYVYKNPTDSTDNFYTKRIPTVPIKGVLVLTLRSLSNSSKDYALRNGILLLSVIPVKADNALLYMTDDLVLTRIDEMITEVIHTYHIPVNKVIIGGMSVAGTASIRYAEYCSEGHSKGKIQPVGAFGVDPPLDYERFYKASYNAVKRNFNTDAVDEGKAIVKLFNQKFGGSPNDYLKAYQVASPFCYSAINGGNARLLDKTAIRLYTEPDINWWIENRRRDYYDFNSIDEAALINQLKLDGNTRAELITTINKGYQEDGSRHPHSWSIIDEKDMLDWCLLLFRR